MAACFTKKSAIFVQDYHPLHSPLIITMKRLGQHVAECNNFSSLYAFPKSTDNL